MEITQGSVPRVPWNKGKLVGQKAAGSIVTPEPTANVGPRSNEKEN